MINLTNRMIHDGTKIKKFKFEIWTRKINKKKKAENLIKIKIKFKKI